MIDDIAKFSFSKKGIVFTVYTTDRTLQKLDLTSLEESMVDALEKLKVNQMKYVIENI